MEVVILWPLVIQQEGFPEKQDIQGEPDKLNHMEKEIKELKISTTDEWSTFKYIRWTQYAQWNLN